MAESTGPEADRTVAYLPRGLGRVLGRLRTDESGNALVLSIAAVLLTGLLMGVVFSSVMFTIGNTTANRANAESRAAAEGGAQQVARELLRKSTDLVTYCPASLDASTLDPNGWTDYEVVDVHFREKPSSGWTLCSATVGIPKLAEDRKSVV